MEQKNLKNKQSSLELVRYEFESWRRIRKSRREPIPEQLWGAAVALTKQYPINRVSKALRLNYTELKNHSQPQNSIQQVENKTSTFVELDGSDVLTPSECIVEMEDSAGAKMRLCFRGKTDFDLLELGKTFWNHKR
jgi:hypothetical protein